MMADKKRTEQEENEQFQQLLKDLGITSYQRAKLSPQEKKKTDDIFPK